MENLINEETEVVENELKNIIKFLKLIQPKQGYSNYKLIYALVAYFNKDYFAEAKYKLDFINMDESFVKINNKKITIGFIINKLKKAGVINYNSIHVEDIDGNKLFNNNFPIIRKLMKFNDETK